MTKLLLFITVLVMIAKREGGVIKRNVVCGRLPDTLLTEILGPAYNSRYMSIDEPVVAMDGESDGGYKRTSGGAPAFYVDDKYAHSVGDDDDEPAWAVNHYTAKRQKNDGDEEVLRGKRAAGAPQRQWECESRINWMDLGPDYFPRYLRSVECTAKTCWYGHYKCKPRSFTVKILRRKRDRCTIATPGNKVGLFGLPTDLRELWVWEERAVNFCCDCAL